MFGKIGSLVKNCLNKFSFTKLRRNFIMPVVSGAEFLKAARKGGYAVGGFNTNELGYTSVMFDGSHLPFEENLKLAKDVVEKAHAKGISVECEVGSIGGEEDGIIGNGELADIEECKQMVATGIDYLACGIGNIHGQYPENWKGLAFDHLQAIADAVGPDMPLVLHGGSGIPQDQIEKAISMGISKVNVNTEFQLSFAAATRKYIEAGKDKEGKGFDPRKLLAPGKAAIVEDAKSHIDWFGSANKA